MGLKMQRSRTLRQQLRRDVSGTISLEFALVLPLLLLGIFGTTAAIDVLNAKRRVDMVGSQVGELTAGLPVIVTDNDLVQIARAARLVLSPYPVNDLTITLKSVRYDNTGANPCVDWSERWPRTGSGTPTAANWETGNTTLPADIPAGFATINGAMIVAEVRYTMTSPYAGLLNGMYSNLVMTDRSLWTPEDLVFLRRVVNIGDPPKAGLCPF